MYPLHAQRVADLRTAQCVEVVHRVRDDLRTAEGLRFRQVEGELRRRLRLGRVLEDEADSVDLHLLGVRSTSSVGRTSPNLPRAGSFPSPVST